MPITFFTQSNNKKDNAPIWVRYTDANSDAKTRTPLYIENGRLEKGKIKKYKGNSSLPTNERQLIKDKNLSLDKVEEAMQKIKRLIVNEISDNPTLSKKTSKWLKTVVNQTNELVLKDHIQNWVDSKSSLEINSITSAKQFQSFMEKHFDVGIKLNEIDLRYFDIFKTSLLDKEYSARNINHKMGYLKAVCSFAEERGSKLNFKANSVKRLKEKKAIKSYLTFDDLKKIQDLKISDFPKVSSKDLQVARDWLVISCFTAMRSIDIYKLTNSNIIGNNIVFRQKKTDSKDVIIPISSPVQKILDHYKGFPPKDTTQSKDTWKQRYERHIKKVCKLAGINETVEYKRKNTIIETEKYNTITTHIGRMSFATNFYGRMPTSNIMFVTGHSSEEQLLTYINKNRVVNSKDLRDKINAIINLENS